MPSSLSLLAAVLVTVASVVAQRHGYVQDTTIGNVPDGVAPLGPVTFPAAPTGRYIFYSLNISQDGWYPDQQVGYELAIISMGMFIGSAVTPAAGEPVEIGLYKNCLDSAQRNKPCAAPLATRHLSQGLSDNLNLLNNFDVMVNHNDIIWILISLPSNQIFRLYNAAAQINVRSAFGAISAFGTAPLTNHTAMQNIGNNYVNYNGPVANPPYDNIALTMWVTVQQRRVGHQAIGTGDSSIATLGGEFANLTHIGPPLSTTTTALSTTTTTTSTTNAVPPLPSASSKPTGTPGPTSFAQSASRPPSVTPSATLPCLKKNGKPCSAPLATIAIGLVLAAACLLL